MSPNSNRREHNFLATEGTSTQTISGKTVREIALRRRLRRVFEGFKIDFCCKGREAAEASKSYKYRADPVLFFKLKTKPHGRVR